MRSVKETQKYVSELVEFASKSKMCVIECSESVGVLKQKCIELSNVYETNYDENELLSIKISMFWYLNKVRRIACDTGSLYHNQVVWWDRLDLAKSTLTGHMASNQTLDIQILSLYSSLLRLITRFEDDVYCDDFKDSSCLNIVERCESVLI